MKAWRRVVNHPLFEVVAALFLIVIFVIWLGEPIK